MPTFPAHWADPALECRLQSASEVEAWDEISESQGHFTNNDLIENGE